MSVDVCWTFRSVQLKSDSEKSSSSRFRLFSLVGWVLPLIVTFVTLLIDTLAGEPRGHFLPNFGRKACWFNGEWQVGIYFYAPITALVTVNAGLFGCTVRGIWNSKFVKISAGQGRNQRKAKKKVILRQHSKNTQKNLNRVRSRLILNAKLFVIMGLSWAFEVLSWLVGSKVCWLWYLTDILNILQGVAICCIFVIKQSVLEKLRKLVKCTK